jgi:hypothetical protein
VNQELQAILDRKIESAKLSLQEMGQALHPEVHDPRYAPLESAGVLSLPWQSARFWKALEAFITTIRSIPDVIQAWCGDYRQQHEPWFLKISAGEKARRKLFQSKFKPFYFAFSKLPLSKGRRVTIHTKGVPPVDVVVRGRESFAPIVSSRADTVDQIVSRCG